MTASTSDTRADLNAPSSAVFNSPGLVARKCSQPNPQATTEKSIGD